MTERHKHATRYWQGRFALGDGQQVGWHDQFGLLLLSAMHLKKSGTSSELAGSQEFE